MIAQSTHYGGGLKHRLNLRILLCHTLQLIDYMFNQAERCYLCFLQVLDGDLDFSTVHTMTAIEKFLKGCTEKMSNWLFRYALNNPFHMNSYKKFHLNSHVCFYVNSCGRR